MRGGHLMRLKLIRRASTPLDFDGDLIAEASSREPGKERWSDLYLFRRSDQTDGWVLSTVGRSLLPGEGDLCNAVACVLPEDVARALLKSDSSSGTQRFYFSNVALDLLEAAMKADPRLAVLSESVEDLV